MPRILILMPTRTYRAAAFLEAATHLGLDVTVGTERDQPLAALTPGATVALDFHDERRAQRQILEFAREYPLDAVVGVDDETTVLAAVTAKALNLPHNTVDSVKATRYKDVMRALLSETDLPSPEFDVVGLHEDPAKAAQRQQYPVVIKPLALSASRGVIRANTPEEFVAAFRETASIVEESDLAPDDPARAMLLVERFIPGREYALEGLLIDGRLTTLALFDKPDPLDGPYFEETIYVTPSRLPQADQQAIARAVEKAALALGLREGPIHAEIRLNEAGPWVVEVAARSIGGLCSNVLRFGYGESLEEIILRQAARLAIPSLERERQPAGVMMIPIPGSGILRGVEGLEAARSIPGIESVTISIPLGQPVVAVPRSMRYLGFIFARDDTPASVEAALRTAHAHLRFDIREEPPRSES